MTTLDGTTINGVVFSSPGNERHQSKNQENAYDGKSKSESIRVIHHFTVQFIMAGARNLSVTKVIIVAVTSDVRNMARWIAAIRRKKGMRSPLSEKRVGLVGRNIKRPPKQIICKEVTARNRLLVDEDELALAFMAVDRLSRLEVVVEAQGVLVGDPHEDGGSVGERDAFCDDSGATDPGDILKTMEEESSPQRVVKLEIDNGIKGTDIAEQVAVLALVTISSERKEGIEPIESWGIAFLVSNVGWLAFIEAQIVPVAVFLVDMHVVSFLWRYGRVVRQQFAKL